MQKYRTNRGSITIYMMTIIGIVSFLLLTLLVFAFEQIRYSYFMVSRTQALHIAEAGIEYYRWYLVHETDGKTVSQIESFWNSGTARGVGTPYEGSFGDNGHYRITVTPPQTGQTAITVVSVGWTDQHPDVQRTIQVRLRRPSWSEYSVISNVYTNFGNETTVYGPIHSNGGIRMDGIARNRVASALSSYYDTETYQEKPGVWTAWANEYNTSMGGPVFQGGKAYPVPVMDFNGIVADIATMRTAAQSSGNYFDATGSGRHITLRADGTYTIKTVTNAHNTSHNIITEGAATTRTIPQNGVIFVENNVWVDGTVADRHVTVVAGPVTASAYIPQDLLYTYYDGRDVIGIVAGANVDTPQNSEDDLRIDAALLAQNGRVGRSRYHYVCVYDGFKCLYHLSSDYKTIVTVFGAIASRTQYGFRWTDGSGYQTRAIYYDNNLLYNPPPLFPTGTHYVPDLWEEL